MLARNDGAVLTPNEMVSRNGGRRRAGFCSPLNERQGAWNAYAPARKGRTQFDVALLAGPCGQCARDVDAVARCGRDGGKSRIEREQTFIGLAGEKVQGIGEIEPA